MAHTKGPWHWETEDEGDIMILCGEEGIEDLVVEARKCASCAGTESRCTLPTEDNARLLQAAPLMLEALEMAEHAADMETQFYNARGGKMLNDTDEQHKEIRRLGIEWAESCYKATRLREAALAAARGE